jgi:ribonuclease R
VPSPSDSDGSEGTIVSDRAERELLEFVAREDYRPMPQRELLHRLHVGPTDRPAVRRIIRRVLQSGRLVRVRGGKLAGAPARDLVRGKLRRLSTGHGVVEPSGGGEPIHVSARQLGAARAGAEVVVRLSGRRSRDGLPQGSVLRVLEPPRARLGLLASRGRGTWIRPFDPAAEGPLHVAPDARNGASGGDVVRWAPVRGGDRNGPLEAEVVEVLGRFDDPATDTVVVAASHGLEFEFPERVLAAAAQLPEAVGRAEAVGRERFGNPAPVTIDGETARDFDDAIAVERRRHGFRLWVHVADVAHFVRPSDPIDEEAARRGTSVYFPDRVIPMLPERLSNDLCSLRPHEDRLVQSAIIDFGEDGEPLSARFADGVIRSAARLTYTEVAAVLDGEQRKGIDPGVRAMLEVADRLRDLLERRRRERGSIDFDLPEPQILLDVEGVMTGIRVEPRNRAHRMIEEFMIAANEAVARTLEGARRGTLYRIHERPDPAKVEVLASFAARLGLELRTDDGKVRSSDIQRLLDEAAQRRSAGVLGHVALRTMSQARYSPDNVGHFGLASVTYCHFTSPIRRYPDLMTHRQLRALRQGGAPPPPASHVGLATLGEQCSRTERRAEAAEREVLARKKLAFIAEHEGEAFGGVVTGVAAFGLFVQLVDNLVEGLVRVESLGAEWFAHDATRFELVGATTGRAFRLGDRVRVRVDRVDRVLQRVDFSLEGLPPPVPTRPAPRRGPARKTERSPAKRSPRRRAR